GQVEYEAEVDISLVSLSGVLQQLERRSKTNIVFLDACRDNPFADKLAKSSNRSAVSLAKGLGRVQAGSGTFVAFSTQPDAAAAAPESEQVASPPPTPRSVAEPEKSGVCETGPFEVDYCTSSALPTSAANHYDPGMMFDGNRATAWAEADKGDGIGETITLHFGRQRSLVGFEIINGYDKDQKIWSANSRVAELEAETGDGQ